MRGQEEKIWADLSFAQPDIADANVRNNMDNELSEENTFRILSRRPLDEVEEFIFKKIVLSGGTLERNQFEELVNSCGYSLEEYHSYVNSEKDE